MANLKVRHFSTRPCACGELRYYWQPTTSLRRAGWKNRRLPNSFPLAIAKAEQINQELDKWRDEQSKMRIPSKRYNSGTVEGLISKYKASKSFTGLRPKTKRSYKQNMKIIKDTKGKEPIRSITCAALQKYYDQMRRKTPTLAIRVIGMWSILLGFASRYDLVDNKVTRELKLDGANKRQVFWTDQEFDAMIAAADAAGAPSIGTAIMLALFLEQRQGDVLRLRWKDYDGEVMKLQQRKTGQRVEIKVLPELAERLARVQRTDDTILIYEATGCPYGEDTFRQNFQKIRRTVAAKLPEVERIWFSDLRRTLVVWLDEEGTTEAQIAAVTGHKIESTRQILETYLVRTAPMAASAMDNLAARRARLNPEPDDPSTTAMRHAVDETNVVQLHAFRANADARSAHAGPV